MTLHHYLRNGSSRQTEAFRDRANLAVKPLSAR